MQLCFCSGHFADCKSLSTLISVWPVVYRALFSFLFFSSLPPSSLSSFKNSLFSAVSAFTPRPPQSTLPTINLPQRQSSTLQQATTREEASQITSQRYLPPHPVHVPISPTYLPLPAWLAPARQAREEKETGSAYLGDNKRQGQGGRQGTLPTGGRARGQD